MKNSIVKKVFLSILTILTLTLGLQLIFQVFFVADVYMYFRQNEMENNFEEVIDENRKDYEMMTNELYLSDQIPILVLDDKQQIINKSFFDQLSYVLVDTENGVYKVVLGTRVNEYGKLEDGFTHLTNGNEAAFTGALLKGNNVIFLDEELSNPLFDSLTSIKGRIIATNFVDKEADVFSHQAEKIIRETGLLISEGTLHDDNIDFVESETGLIINLIVREIDGHYCITLYTIEDLSNTFSILNDFYIYFFIFQVILLIFVSWLYTRWFTRPLRLLNEEAKAIASSDFDQISQIKSGDELEELSDSLNSIAENMKQNIETLKSEAREKAESENRMRELLANLSHEFKTPLGIISGFIEMMEYDDENKEYYIRTINAEIERLNGLTRETLLLCESENFSSVINKKIITLNNLCDLSKFQKQLEDKSQTLVIDLPDISVFCDISKIGTVIDNLISNAIKYSDDNETISLYAENVENNNIRIHVRNTGITIDEEEMDKIWNKYYRLEKSRNKDYGGNGIGLAISKNILEAHQSHYGVYNEENSVVFFFELEKA